MVLPTNIPTTQRASALHLAASCINNSSLANRQGEAAIPRNFARPNKAAISTAMLYKFNAMARPSNVASRILRGLTQSPIIVVLDVIP